MKVVYLDHNATTPPHEDVLEAMARTARDSWANPASLHSYGREARRVVEDARDQVAALVGESSRDVLFTSGGTEANNLGLVRPFARGGGGLLVTSMLEHPSVLRTAEMLETQGITVVRLPIDATGRYQPAELARALENKRGNQPALVAVHAVHHETGVIQPIGEIIAVAESAGAEVHVDAVQAAGRIEHALWRGGHTTALAAHKLRGPKGVGALATRPGLNAHPILRGGSQERGLRPGTVDPIATSGFGVAARRGLDGGPARYAALASFRDEAERALLALGHDVVARASLRAPHTTLVLVNGWRGDELVAALDLEGVCVSSGSACAAGTAEPSPAVAAIVGAERAISALRISFGETNDISDVAALLRAFQAVTSRFAPQSAGSRDTLTPTTDRRFRRMHRLASARNQGRLSRVSS